MANLHRPSYSRRTPSFFLALTALGLSSLHCSENLPSAQYSRDDDRSILSDAELSGVAAFDETDSGKPSTAGRLIDGVLGTDDAQAWNPGWFAADKFPMRAYVDFGSTRSIKALKYYMGNYIRGSQEVSFFAAPDSGGKPGAYTPLLTSRDEGWQWVTRTLPAVVSARYVRIQFAGAMQKFNVSELRIVALGSSGTDGGASDAGMVDASTGGDASMPPLPATPLQAKLPSEMTPPVPLSHGFGTLYTHPDPVCQRRHDRYWTRGPDGNAYHTWHPAGDKEAGVSCVYGHEHGDDPWSSAYYIRRAELRYKWLWDEGYLPIPFGYANQVLMATDPAGHRHEDHVGHKVFWEHFLAAYGNGANAGQVAAAKDAAGNNIVCDALLKPHQGTHSQDALSNNLHEMVTHIDCSDGTRGHVTLLAPMGRPGWFSNECEYESLAGYDLRPGRENNAPAPFAPARTNPIARRSEQIVVDGTDETTPNGPDGERTIPGAGCVDTWVDPSDSDWRGKYGHAMMEAWTIPVYITKGTESIFKFRPYVSVLNTARVHRAAQFQPTIDSCRAPLRSGMKRSQLCQLVVSRGVMRQDSPDSPFNGTVRAVNFKGVHIKNTAGPLTYTTDAFGRVITGTSPTTSIKQFISNTDNNWYRSRPEGGVNYAGILATLPTAGTNGICVGPATGSTYATCGKGLKFSVEWFRDYSGLQGVHAPN